MHFACLDKALDDARWEYMEQLQRMQSASETTNDGHRVGFFDFPMFIPPLSFSRRMT
jgi:hypothetical protein